MTVEKRIRGSIKNVDKRVEELKKEGFLYVDETIYKLQAKDKVFINKQVKMIKG